MRQFNFTVAQIAKLMQMQDQLNTYIHADWKAQDFDWYEAIIDECGEIKAHLGWKWWKPGYQCGVTEANKPQIKLEVIDILHFLISGMIELSHSAEVVAEIFNAASVTERHTLDSVVSRLRYMACDGYYPAVTWAWLAQLLGMTEQEILETYTQKYVLNKFRQDHGYKTGEYVKEWKLEKEVVAEHKCELPGYIEYVYEDNQVLEFVVASYKAAGLDTTDETLLYNKLESLYNSRLNKG